MSQQVAAQSVRGAEKAALDYLAREVPLWKVENGCYSCHNNGDGARALYVARRLGWELPEGTLEDTTGWLSRPGEWDNNRGDPEFSDKKLARIQFAAALQAAVEGGEVSREALAAAARSLLPYQEEDGAWRVDEEGSVGSPITYGAALATYTARSVLVSEGDVSFDEAVGRATRWFEASEPKSMPDAAATVLALAGEEATGAVKAKRLSAIALIVGGQNGDGGWGPFGNSPSEPFDTALALLALKSGGEAHGEQIRHGRAFLLETQLSPGGWIETTRPAGSQSYAQHISTTAWALLALLETAEQSRF